MGGRSEGGSEESRVLRLQLLSRHFGGKFGGAEEEVQGAGGGEKRRLAQSEKFDTTAAVRLGSSGEVLEEDSGSEPGWKLLSCLLFLARFAPLQQEQLLLLHAPPGSPPARKLGGFDPDFGAQRLQTEPEPEPERTGPPASAGSLSAARRRREPLGRGGAARRVGVVTGAHLDFPLDYCHLTGITVRF